MTKDIIKKLIFIWVIISLLVDISNAIQAGNSNEYYWLILVFVVIDLLICWTAYQMIKGRRWGLITLTIYFGLRTISIYTDSFSFYIKSGLNMEILIAKTLGINLTSLIVLILLIRELNKSQGTKVDNGQATIGTN